MSAAVAVREAARPLAGEARNYDPLLELARDARFVLLGEASHGTHEFYRERAEITKRLVEELGFDAVAVEADWPDAWRVNCYVHGGADDASANEALADCKRFPQWMWRNADVLEFVEWLRARNDRVREERKVSFYGLDLYSLYASVEAVIEYLERVDPEAARRARARYACFEHFRSDPQAYGYSTSLGAAEPCEQEVVEQLCELRRRAVEYARRDGRVAEDRFFYAEQNARLVKSAEEYYRSLFRGRVSSWNLRDSHMAESLAALATHLERRNGSRSRLVVWAHNSHLGDARATEMREAGELNLGQLVRERHPDESLLVGFTTYAGTVTAASDWGGPAERKRVRRALARSYEALFHEARLGRFLLVLRGANLPPDVRGPRLERAIGVIYRPETERASHYFHARLPHQFDVVLHFDETRAVEPLERTATWGAGELPETFPAGV